MIIESVTFMGETTYRCDKCERFYFDYFFPGENDKVCCFCSISPKNHK